MYNIMDMFKMYGSMAPGEHGPPVPPEWQAGGQQGGMGGGLMGGGMTNMDMFGGILGNMGGGQKEKPKEMDNSALMQMLYGVQKYNPAQMAINPMFQKGRQF